MTQVEREQAERMVNIAWREFAHKVNLPSREPSEDLRSTLMYLVWIATDAERTAQEAVRKLAVEDERAFFIELCERVIKANNQIKGDGSGINLLMADLINKIRARSAEKSGHAENH